MHRDFGMEDVNDSSVKREGFGPYSHAPPAVHRMPPTETSGSHSYLPPHSGSAIQHSWQPSPSPYESGEHRPPPDAPPHTPYPAHYPPHGREPGPPPGYGQEHSYGRQGSISAPTRSPPEAQHAHFQAVNGAPHDPRYYQTYPPPEYRQPSHSYGPPESPANGTQAPPNLHIATAGPEMITGPPPGHPQYGPPSAGGHPYPPQYYSAEYPRRKPVRAAQACDSCRQRKAKCDEGRPECQHCKDNNLKCSYREVPPQKQEKHVMALNDKLDSMERGFADHQTDIRRLLTLQDGKINQLTSMIERAIPLERTPKSAHSAVRLKRETSHPMAANQMLVNQSFSSQPDQETSSNEQKKSDEELSFPAEHFTAAQNLLDWDPVKSLLPRAYSKSYVIDLESNRGLLRLYGCGEGEDKNDGGEGAASPAGSSTSSGRLDDETSQPSPGGVWGSGQLPPPSPAANHGSAEHAGGVSALGGLVLDAAVVDRYHRSYMEHMHILHPFLDSKVLRDMVQLFKRRYSPDYVWQSRLSSITGKRKRELEQGSPGMLYEHTSAQLHTRHHLRHPGAPPAVEHSVTNAIILLVIALGKICNHRHPLPGPMSPSAIATATPQNTYADIPMSSASAPTSPFHSGGLKQDTPGLALGGPSNPQGKNMDVIPGLAYFAKAADILGELAGGNDVSHVQANLLAGLYMGQLARILPSHYYISAACRACMVLVDSTPYHNHTMPHSRRNLVNFAFWSCLQLESDILAELELPPSGISRYEARMVSNFPTGITLDPPDPDADHKSDILRFYANQMQLRRTLNDIHRDLYRGKATVSWKELVKQKQPSGSIMTALDTALEGWRTLLGMWNWNDDDHQSPDINVARMRGKYYGAKYIIHRPALYYALSVNAHTSPCDRPSESPIGAGHGSQLATPPLQLGQHRGGRSGEMGPPHKYGDHLDEKVMDAARTCVEAAIRSTTAFDGVPPRLIITNIFGTAHAQFGNILVLAATFNASSPLSSLIDERTMRGLLSRTIGFLKLNENISPTLKYDAEILQDIKRNLFPESSSASTSFMSYPS